MKKKKGSYEIRTQWDRKIQRSKTTEDEKWDCKEQESNKKENKTTTKTKVTKVKVVVERRLDTNPTGLTHKCE